MKIQIDIDCTPEEARTFLGLPDVAPMQQAMLKQMEDNMLKATNVADPEAMMKMWFPLGQQGMETLTKVFQQVARSQSNRDGDDPANGKS